MRLGYQNSFDVLVDAQADQEKEAVRQRADAHRRDPAFLRAVNDDQREFDGSNWASIGRLVRQRDDALSQATARHAKEDAWIAERHRAELKQLAERQRREIIAAHELFETGQSARLNFLAWRAVQA